MVKQRSSARNIATNYISNEDGVSTDLNLGNSRALDIGSRLADDQASVGTHAMLDAIKGIDVAGGETLANGLLMLGQNVDREVFGLMTISRVAGVALTLHIAVAVMP